MRAEIPLMIDRIHLIPITRCCFVFAAILFTFSSWGQTADSSTYYFDGQWALCDSSEAVYYRRCIWKDKKLAIVDYYKSTHTPQMIGFCADKGGSIKTDTAIFFSRKGNIEQTGRFVMNKADGLWISYFDSGMKDSEGSYTNGKKNGEWFYFHPNGKKSSLEMYENDTMRNMQCWDNQGITLSVCHETKLPEFPGGENKLNEFISEVIEYPVYCREEGIQGRVVMRFMIDTTGVLYDFDVVYSTRKSFSDEALRVLKSMPRWNVYPNHNRMIPIEYRIPFIFRLD